LPASRIFRAVGGKPGVWHQSGRPNRAWKQNFPVLLLVEAPSDRYRQWVTTPLRLASRTSGSTGAFKRATSTGRVGASGLTPCRDQAGETTGGNRALTLEAGLAGQAVAGQVDWEPQRWAVGSDAPPVKTRPGWLPVQNLVWNCRKRFSGAGGALSRCSNFLCRLRCTNTAVQVFSGVLRSACGLSRTKSPFSPKSVASQPAGSRDRAQQSAGRKSTCEK